MIYFKSMKKTAKTILSIFISFIMLVSILPFKAYATEADLDAVIEERKNIPVESNMITGWPVGPKTGAQSAILIDANTGIVLYSKNIHEKLYPASITKILTALIAYENCDMNDMVTFSYNAVSSIDWRYDANMGINAGDSIPMEQALYGMLVGSANEAAYAIAEHVSGNIEDFAVLMNTKARELGCTDSHFVTPNGIHDEDHYTSAHDMALIAKAFFANDFLANISRTPSYQVPQTSTQPNDNMIVYAKSKLFPGKEYALDGLVGTKTGYTDSARQTLVTCAENDSLRLICVVMKEEAPGQYTDTIDLFNYGFSNFTCYTVADKDSRYTISTSNLFDTQNDIFGSSKPILDINSQDYIILPVGVEPEQTESDISYDDLKDNEIARINYYYSGTFVGSASVMPIGILKNTHGFEDSSLDDTGNEADEDDGYIFVDITWILVRVLGVTALLTLLFILVSLFKGRHKRKKTNTNKKFNYKNKNLKWKHFR